MSDLWAQEMLNVPFDESTAPFKRADFTEMGTEEIKGLTLNYYISTDFATQEKQKSDYSAFIIAGMDSRGILYIVKVIQERMESPEILETLFLLNKKYNPMSIFVETGQIWATLKPLVVNEMYRTGDFFTLEELPSITDKRSRTASIRGRMRVGAVKFDKQADWYPDFEEECLRFPQGHDDQVDALSLLGLALNKFVEAPTPEEEAEEHREEEMESAGFFHGGRNEITGY
jgi:predicted phage terminase large subunit-like protein